MIGHTHRSPRSSSHRSITPGTIAQMAANSASRFVTLTRHSQLHRSPDRLGADFRVDDGRSYRVFRETDSDAAPADSPTVLVVGFQLKALRTYRLPHWLFQRCCLLTTPFWSGLPGFAVKLWMVDPHSKRYLGIYDWRGTQSAQQYVDALTQVLRALSTKGSVWYRLLPNCELEPYLAAHTTEPTQRLHDSR